MEPENEADKALQVAVLTLLEEQPKPEPPAKPEPKKTKHPRKSNAKPFDLGKAQAWSLGLEGCYFYGLTDIQKKYMRNLSPRYNTTYSVQLSLSYSF